jgi:hypothetical protein
MSSGLSVGQGSGRIGVAGERERVGDKIETRYWLGYPHPFRHAF